MALVVVLASFIGLTQWRLDIYSITPGNSESVAPLIKVTGLTTDSHQDSILLTDVYLTPLTAWDWIVAHFRPHTEIIGGSLLESPGVPTSELDAQGYLEMAVSKQNARVAAFDALGWKIPTQSIGATVDQLSGSSSAWLAGMNVADQIVGVGSTAVHSGCDLDKAVRRVPAGSSLTLHVRPAAISAEGDVTVGKIRDFKVTPASVPSSQLLPPCSGFVQSLGMVTEDAFAYRFPAVVNIHTPMIGGPSAGLAMTLALIDRLSAGSLTGNRVIAATGTIDPSGNVGDVGGVLEKTVSVENAHASIFIVPQVEVKTAQSVNNGTLHIIGVQTLAQALAALRSLGGALPMPYLKPYPLNPLP